MKIKIGTVRKKIIAFAMACTLVMAAGVTYAWYTGTESVSATREEVEVMTPYFLYLLNPGTTDSLQFAIGNLHPAETKQTVICVSNKKPDDVTDDSIDIARVSDFDYELEFITTNNLEVNYKIYELNQHTLAAGADVPESGIQMPDVDGIYWTKKGEALEGTNTSAERHAEALGTSNPSGVVNKGTYTLYSKDSSGGELHLIYENGKYDYDYYLIEVDWKDDTSFERNRKETDVNYVVVNAMQPKPVAD